MNTAYARREADREGLAGRSARACVLRALRSGALAAAVLSAALAVGEAATPGPPGDAASKAGVRRPPDTGKTLAAQARLAWRLIADAPPGAGTAMSPAGLASIFAVLSEGADARLKASIAKALGFEGRDREAALVALKAARTAVAAADPAVFVSRDRLVFAPGEAPGEQLARSLDALAIPFVVADLTKADAVKAIDAWVRTATGGAIPEILGEPLKAPGFVALNALRFKGRWRTPFDRGLTADAPFMGADRTSGPVAMMRLPEAERAYRAQSGFVGVDLPFEDARYSLVVVTSDGPPKTVKDFAAAADWLSGAGFSQRKGDLALPRFSLEGRADLLPTLAKAGLAEGLRSPTALAGFAPDLTIRGDPAARTDRCRRGRRGGCGRDRGGRHAHGRRRRCAAHGRRQAVHLCVA